ncbi:hypothetical protein HDV00_010506 [Rhizophlyctis rosea]|nr:hypothetical protein HDV00_010506 [Rhizophlyctis rosea]
MPLFRRKVVDLNPPPSEESVTDPNAEVFQIRFTGEIFDNYDDYYKRYNYYRKPVFACEKTGKLNLTFEEALESEKEARRRVQEKFPDVWRKPACERIHYSILKLNPLVDDLYEFFRAHIYPGEIVIIEQDDESYLARVLAQVPNKEMNGSTSDSDEPEEEGPYFKVDVVDEELEPVMEERDEAGDGQEERQLSYVLPASQIKRDRQVLSKMNFKKFLREVATKDVWIGAPWIVRAELVQRYGLSMDPPADVAKIYKQRSEPKQRSPKKKKGEEVEESEEEEEDKKGGKGKKGKKGEGKGKGKKRKSQAGEEEVNEEDGEQAPKSKKRGPDKGPRKSRAQKVKLTFPMEDTEMHQLAPPRTQLEDGRPVPNRPALSHDFGEVPEEYRTVFLQVYQFLSTFGRPLHLSPFTFDDFLKALSHRGADQEVVLLSEAFGCVVAVCCREWSHRLEDNSPPPNPSISDRLHVLQNPEAQAASDECAQLYVSFGEEEKAAVDQWWKWYPGRWATGYEVRKGSYMNLLGTRTGPDVGRLKAWQVALAGIVKDWVGADRVPEKFSVLAQLLTGERRGGGGEGSGSNGKVNGVGEGSDVEEGEGAKEEENGDMDVDEVGAEEESSEDEISEGYGARSKRRKIVIDDDEEDDDWKPDADGPTARPSRSSRSTPGGTPPITGGRSRASAKAASVSNAAIDRLCRKAERGFGQLGLVERLELLWFMIEECVGHSRVVREYLDECFEKILELRKEKRSVLKERRDAIIARIELDKRDRELDAGEGGEGEANGDADADDMDMDSPNDPMHTDVSTPAGSDSETDEEPKRRKSISSASRHKSRVQKLREEQLRREAQEQRRKEEYEKMRKEHRDRQKELKARAEERKKIEDTESTLLRREVAIDTQVTYLSARSRMLPLGTDRYHNQYWFFDEGLGALPAHVQALGVGVGGLLLGDGKGKGKGGKGGVGMEWFCGREGVVGGVGLGSGCVGEWKWGGRWGCYTEPEQFSNLLDWVDPRGIRERELREALDNISDIVINGMNKRNEDITAALQRHEHAPQRRTRLRGSGANSLDDDGIRDPYMDYVNRMAK